MAHQPSVLEFEYSQARTISRKLNFSNPEESDSIRTHFLFVLLKDIPVNLPDTPNPRKPDLSARPCKQMQATLDSEPRYFTDCNRGLLLTVDKATYVEGAGKKSIVLDFGIDEDGVPKGGIVDGNHSYAVLKRAKLEGRTDLDDMPVFLTVIEGAGEFATELARARNTSVQVADKSIANLEKEFDGIKEGLGQLKEKVVFYENEHSETSTATVPIEELISLMTALNVDLYGQDKQPTISYTGTASCFQKWLNKKNRQTYDKLNKLLPEIVDAYEYLYEEYKNYAVKSGTKKFGGINGVDTYTGKGDKRKAVEIHLPFSGHIVNYRLSRGFILPIFAALRFLLVEKNGEMQWSVSPRKYLDKYGPELVGAIIKAHTTEYGSNSNRTGKSTVLWQNVANKVLITSLEERLAAKT